VYIPFKENFTPADQANWPADKIIMRKDILLEEETRAHPDLKLTKVTDPMKLIAPALKVIMARHQPKAKNINVMAAGIPVIDFKGEVIFGNEMGKFGGLALLAAVNENIADDNGFSKRISFISKTDFVLRKAIYYDLEGRLEKELIVKEIKEINPENHKYAILHMVMENKQNERKSIMKIEKIVFNPDIKDDYFTTRYLERL
jgi:hypothetical protein